MLKKYELVQAVDSKEFSDKIEALEEKGYVRQGGMIMKVEMVYPVPGETNIFEYGYLLNQMMRYEPNDLPFIKSSNKEKI